MSGKKDCHDFRFSIVRIVVSVSNITNLWDCFYHCLCNCLCNCHCILLVRSYPLIALIKCVKGHKSPGLSVEDFYSATKKKKWCFKFSTILTIFTILHNLYNFHLVFQFWQLTTIDDHFHNSDNCFCHFDNWKNNPGDLWDTDYNSDNWEPEFMTIFVTWQLIVTLDSIRNSCDVCNFRFVV